MPDKTLVPAYGRFDIDVLDTPAAIAAMDSIEQFVRAGSDGVLILLVDAIQRIALVRSYLHLLEDELKKEVARAAEMVPA